MKGLKPEWQRLKSADRLYQLPVPAIGLTGGISTGKSTVARILLDQGLSVINADQLVKGIYALQETQAFIQTYAPEVIAEGTINFKALREKFFKDPKVKKDIEDFIYQRLPGAFIEAYGKLSSPALVIYDVPLLFEKKLEKFFDLTVLVYAPRKIQRARLMERDGHLEDMANVILNQQMDIEDKKSRVDFVIDNSGTQAELGPEVSRFLRQITT